MNRRLKKFFIWRMTGKGVRRHQPPFVSSYSDLNSLPGTLPDISQPTPEDFAPAPPKELTPFQKWPEPGLGRPVTIIYLLFTVLSISNWGVPMFWNNNEVYRTELAVSKIAVFTHGEYWRLFSALFVHADLMHLMHNTLTFLFFGWILRGYFGWLAFPFLSLIVGALSNLATIYMYDGNTHLLGASGMIYGMVAMWLTLYIVFDRTSPMPHRVMRSLGFSLMILFPQSYEARTSYTAHASGFIIGLVVAIIFIPVMRHTAPVLKK